MFKDYGSHRTHLDGIYRILELRGGIDNLRLTQPLVYWRIIWCIPRISLLSTLADDKRKGG